MATGLFNLKQVNQAISQGAWSGYIAPKWVEYLVVAGGGSGGAGSTLNCGGGGAGGLLTGIVSVTTGTSYTVTVGAGGGASSSGASSVFGSISTTGGGRAGSGGTIADSGVSGGSGGGGNSGGSVGGQGTSNQGNAGGTGFGSANGTGGGGGAGTVGLNGTSSISGNGGAGIASAITGTVTTYAGGGGGAASSGTSLGAGGVGGGGAGGSYATGIAGAGSPNTGGGGGGYYGSATGTGGSGIVVVRYPGNVQFYTGGTVTYSNGYIVHNFTANGTLAPTTPTVVSEYQISRSLRFNSADSPYLSRTPSATSSQTTATFSAWVKRSRLGSAAENRMFAESTGSGAGLFWVLFTTSDQLQVLVNGTGTNITSTQVFRDPSAWYHIVAAVDTNQAIASDRIKLYVNGTQITAFTGTQTYYTQGQLVKFNVTTTTNYIGYNNSQAFDGYMTEVNWIDGQQLTPTSFGYVNPATGVWTPAKYVGGYGTNGFYLNFSDNSNTTAATLGKDYSGNGNNWTPTGFSVSTGAGNDSLVDVPTPYGVDTGVGGTVRGNYCTLNPLATGSGKVLVNGNLEFTSSTSNWYFSLGTIGFSSGKYYWEMNCGATNGSDLFAGIMGSGVPVNGANGLQDNATALNTFGSLLFCDDGKYQLDGNLSRVAYSTALASNQTLGIAVDMDAKSLTFYKDNVSQGAISFSSSPMASSIVCPSFSSYATSDSNRVFNFGQRPFEYTAPSGFKALCTQNLPTPTIGATTATQAGKYFAPTLYTGNGTSQTITTGFMPNLVWIKSRSNAQSHFLHNNVDNVSLYLSSNNTSAEGYDTTSVTAISSTGFSLGTESNHNGNGNTYVAWGWNASGSSGGSTNTSGTITSTVSANTTSGFSIVTYTGTGANATVGHGLGVAPKMVIVKNRTSTGSWCVWHTGLTSGAYALFLESTDAQGSYPTIFNSTVPTSTVFSVGTATGTNASSNNLVAYCFAEVAGYSKFGSYTGNGSADGPFVFTGFRPAYVMFKRTDASSNWYVFDVARNTSNVMSSFLCPNDPLAETSVVGIDFLSNGFKQRGTAADYNASGGTFIYMAFASAPLKFSLAR